MMLAMDSSSTVGAVSISVILSVYNGAGVVREAVESILNQSCGDFEFLILDDGSTDGTAGILEELAGRDRRIRFRRSETNRGLTVSLNDLVGESRGEFVARQDADDVSHPERLALQREFMRRHPEIAVAGSWYDVEDRLGGRRWTGRPPCDPGEIAWQLGFANALAHPTVMWRQAMLRGLGGPGGPYNPAYRTSQDFELWGRVAAVHPLANLPRSLLTRRLHAGQVSVSLESEQETLAVRIAFENQRRLFGEAVFTEAETRRLRDWLIRGEGMGAEGRLLQRYAEASARYWRERAGEPGHVHEANARMLRRALAGIEARDVLRPAFLGFVGRLLLKSVWWFPCVAVQVLRRRRAWRMQG